MTGRRTRASNRGFSLVEICIVIIVIAVLAAIVVPTMLKNSERARVEEARDMVAEVAKTFRRFHDDTGYWPYGNGIWNPSPGQGQSVAPGPFTVNDTVLMMTTLPQTIPALTACLSGTGSPGGACWNGPYLGRGGAMADPRMLDPWGNPLYFTMQRPFDGYGGGVSVAPNGMIVIWSLGPDMLDETGCTTNTNPNIGLSQTSAGCSVNYQNIMQGLPSVINADDLIQVAGTAI